MLVCSECAQEWEWFPFTTQERAPTPPVSVSTEVLIKPTVFCLTPLFFPPSNRWEAGCAPRVRGLRRQRPPTQTHARRHLRDASLFSLVCFPQC
jgi:hypothetical protein